MARSAAPRVVPLPSRKKPSNFWRDLLYRVSSLPRRGYYTHHRPNPFTPARPLPGVTGEGRPKIPQIAMDAADIWKGAVDDGGWGGGDTSWAGAYAQNWFNSAYSEGMEWLGYAVLALLAQRAEYRIMTETIATEMTREWITIKSKSGDRSQLKRIGELETRLRELKLRQMMRSANLNDGFQGRGQIYIDTNGPDDREELRFPLGDFKALKAKYGAGKFIKRLGAIEPMWCYPAAYEATDPLRANWYKPDLWWVMGKEVHRDRLLTFTGHEVPDMLKPAYSFGGQALTQLAKPYVDNWLRNRQSESDLLNNFSLRVLSTELDAATADDGSELFQRALTLTSLADNQGLMIINRSSEEFDIKAAPLGGVPEIVKQSKENMTLPSRMPIVKFFGNQPSGLNADSEGVIRMWYDDILAMQESRNREPIQFVMELAEIELWGEIIDDITFEFNGLWQLDEAGKSAIQKTKADQRAVDIEAGIVASSEARQAALNDPDNQYSGLSLSPELILPQGGAPSESFERGENPNIGAKPPRRDFAESLTGQAARFGGAATGGFPTKVAAE